MVQVTDFASANSHPEYDKTGDDKAQLARHGNSSQLAPSGSVPHCLLHSRVPGGEDPDSGLDEDERQALLREAGERDVERALVKLAAAGGAHGSFALAVGATGFAPYILAAQASAFMPMVSGPALVSLVSVMANPMVVVGAAVGLGAYLTRKAKETGRRAGCATPDRAAGLRRDGPAPRLAGKPGGELRDDSRIPEGCLPGPKGSVGLQGEVGGSVGVLGGCRSRTATVAGGGMGAQGPAPRRCGGRGCFDRRLGLLARRHRSPRGRGGGLLKQRRDRRPGGLRHARCTRATRLLRSS